MNESFPRILYNCPKVDSMKALEAPNSAMTHIQKIAPGPPMVSAVATPTIFPVPIEPARAVKSACTGEILPVFCASLALFFEKQEPSVFFNQNIQWVNGKKPVRILKWIPASKIPANTGQPHRSSRSKFVQSSTLSPLKKHMNVFLRL